jgi:thiamine-monophosphate kinase
MKISELGEFGLIDLLAGMISKAENKDMPSRRGLVIGIGDDAAAWNPGNSLQLATVDVLVQDVHFTLETTSWEELGWKALAVNLSDIAAMGGTPLYALVSLALPGHIDVENIKEMYRGMLELAGKYGVAVIGGNMSGAPLLVINITVLGNAKDKDMILTRSAAKPGDKVAVTGSLGASAGGLEMLVKKLSFKPEVAEPMRKAFVTPSPRVGEGQLLVSHGVKAGIDISDGLIADLRHICEMSKVGARIDVDKVPVHSSVKTAFPEKAVEMALSGGEDYELLFTAGEEIIKKVKTDVSCPVAVIGEIIAENSGKVTLIDKDGNPVDINKPGWQHFGIEK